MHETIKQIKYVTIINFSMVVFITLFFLPFRSSNVLLSGILIVGSIIGSFLLIRLIIRQPDVRSVDSDGEKKGEQPLLNIILLLTAIIVYMLLVDSIYANKDIKNLVPCFCVNLWVVRWIFFMLEYAFAYCMSLFVVISGFACVKSLISRKRSL